MCRIGVYAGSSDLTTNGSGKKLTGTAFQANTDKFHIKSKSIPVEIAYSTSIVEQDRTLLRLAFNIIRKETSHNDEEAALQIAVKAVNDSVGPEGLVPVLLEFDTPLSLGLPRDKR